MMFRRSSRLLDSLCSFRSVAARSRGSAQGYRQRGYATASSSGSSTGQPRYDVTATTLVLALIAGRHRIHILMGITIANHHVAEQPIVTFGLGTWQVKRLQWKVALIDELDEKLSKPPMRLPARIDTSVIPEFAYRKVEVTGRFDHDNEVLLGPRIRESVLGYSVVTPLIRDESDPNSTILINRGHVSATLKDQKSRLESLVGGVQSVVGLLRDQEKRNSFSPANSPEKGEYQFMDIAQMAAATGSQPVLIDQTFEGNAGEMKSMLQHGIPLPRAATIELRNMHVTYAVTWYALSAATSVMLWRLFRRPTRRNNAFQRSDR